MTTIYPRISRPDEVKCSKCFGWRYEVIEHLIPCSACLATGVMPVPWTELDARYLFAGFGVGELKTYGEQSSD